MSRTEFLRALRQKLLESMSASEADEQVRYYDNYIKKAVQNGQNEREVLAALGDPVLIARTILEAPGRRAGEPRKEYSPKRGESLSGTGRKIKAYQAGEHVWMHSGADCCASDPVCGF